MQVLIVRNTAPDWMPDDLSDVVVIGSSPIDFAIDFASMMDRWGGGVAIATISPLDPDRDAYRVDAFEDIPATFRQSAEDAFVLDSLDGEWFMSFMSTDDGIAVEQSGRVPNLSEPPYAALGRFIDSVT